MPVATRRAVRAMAERQAADIDRVTARAGVLSSRIWRIVIDAARANKVHHETVIRIRPFDEELIENAKDELLDIMAFAYLLRRRLAKRRRTQARGIFLASPVHTVAQDIADKFEIDLGNIKKKLEPLATTAIKDSVGRLREVMNDALEESTRSGLPTGEATEEVIEALRDYGVSPRSNYYVENLVRTHAAIAYGAAHRQSFAGDVDLWGWEYVTVGDDRVREAHERLDGIKRKVGDPFWEKFWPPNGWGCRCQAVAIYDEDERQDRVPDDVEPDEGFDFDPGDLI